MKGLMMDYQLTLPAILRRVETLYGAKKVVTRLPDKSFHRYSYADFVRRTKKLAVALQQIGVKAGDRVATLCWNHYQHLEAYFGIPAFGAVLHTLNIRLHPDDLVYIIGHAGDKAILVDQMLLPLFDKFRSRLNIEHVVAIFQDGEAPEGMHDYERLLDQADESEFEYLDLDEKEAAGMCYTSGTTGRPKGVLYTHRGIALHSLGIATPDVLGIRESDVILPVVPMFHANAWGLPFAAALLGASQVFPGSYMDPLSLLEALQAEKVTVTAGVPTVWLGVLEVLDVNPKAYDLSSVRAVLVGGSAAPKSLIQAFEERHGLRMIHAWGMTETGPCASLSSLNAELQKAPSDVQFEYRAKQGLPLPFVEIRAIGDEGPVPWDGKTMGEIELCGPWIAKAYYNSPEAADRFAEDGWLRTGDIATIDRRGYIELTDRTKDLVKSGGEWISSVALESALMGHPAVAEAAVIAVPHPKWQERPLAVVALKEGQTVTADELRAYLEPNFAKWWLPDAIEFVEEIPRTTVGKFMKSALREEFRDYHFPDASRGAEGS